jgi:uncharacterized damage-inducible protein DinB
MDSQPEVWLRGPVPGIPAELLPAAHALLQTIEDVERIAADLTVEQLWQTPGGAASIGFHIMHLTGSTDRLLTYARGERLSPEQKATLSAEQSPSRVPASELIAQLRTRIDAALDELRLMPVTSLYEPRSVGRAGLPTTIIGLLFHAAEHSQRHAGQIVTTAKIVRAAEQEFRM